MAWWASVTTMTSHSLATPTDARVITLATSWFICWEKCRPTLRLRPYFLLKASAIISTPFGGQEEGARNSTAPSFLASATNWSMAAARAPPAHAKQSERTKLIIQKRPARFIAFLPFIKAVELQAPERLFR